LVPAEDLAAPEVMVTCDCAAFDRLGELGRAADAAQELIGSTTTAPTTDAARSGWWILPSSVRAVAGVIDAIGGEMPMPRRSVCMRV
jgi:hypothetical protein